MKMKKTLCAVLAALTITCVFAGCGDNSSSDTSTGSAASAQTQTTADVTAIGEKLYKEVTFEDGLIEMTSDKITTIIGVAEDKYSAAKVYVSGSGATPEEIDCFEANDEASASEIKAALEKRVENQKAVFEDYKPEQMDKLNDVVLVANGKYVYLCISDDNAKAKEIIG